MTADAVFTVLDRNAASDNPIPFFSGALSLQKLLYVYAVERVENEVATMCDRLLHRDPKLRIEQPELLAAAVRGFRAFLYQAPFTSTPHEVLVPDDVALLYRFAGGSMPVELPCVALNWFGVGQGGALVHMPAVFISATQLTVASFYTWSSWSSYDSGGRDVARHAPFEAVDFTDTAACMSLIVRVRRMGCYRGSFDLVGPLRVIFPRSDSHQLQCVRMFANRIITVAGSMQRPLKAIAVASSRYAPV